MTRGGESPHAIWGKPSRRRDYAWGVVSPRATRRIGCVNVTSLGDVEHDGRADLSMKTLNDYGLDICGISEAQWATHLTRKVGAYDIHFSGN